MPVSPPPVLTLHGFLDPATCRRLRAAMDTGVCEEAEVLGLDRSGMETERAVRRATGIEVAPDALAVIEAALDAVRPTLEAFFDCALVEREGSGFLRYGPGGHYRPHRDRAEVPAWPGAARRQVAAVVFLNSARAAQRPGAFDGGWLRLYPGEPPITRSSDQVPIDVVPREGTLVAFLASQWHEVTPVTVGTRDVVVDWYY